MARRAINSLDLHAPSDEYEVLRRQLITGTLPARPRVPNWLAADPKPGPAEVRALRAHINRLKPLRLPYLLHHLEGMSREEVIAELEALSIDDAADRFDRMAAVEPPGGMSVERQAVLLREYAHDAGAQLLTRRRRMWWIPALIALLVATAGWILWPRLDPLVTLAESGCSQSQDQGVRPVGEWPTRGPLKDDWLLLHSAREAMLDVQEKLGVDGARIKVLYAGRIANAKTVVGLGLGQVYVYTDDGEEEQVRTGLSGDRPGFVEVNAGTVLLPPCVASVEMSPWSSELARWEPVTVNDGIATVMPKTDQDCAGLAWRVRPTHGPARVFAGNAGYAGLRGVPQILIDADRRIETDLASPADWQSARAVMCNYHELPEQAHDAVTVRTVWAGRVPGAARQVGLYALAFDRDRAFTRLVVVGNRTPDTTQEVSGQADLGGRVLAAAWIKGEQGRRHLVLAGGPKVESIELVGDVRDTVRPGLALTVEGDKLPAVVALARAADGDFLTVHP